jgi:hypothetical protein
MTLQNAILSFLLFSAPVVLFSQERARLWGDIPESDLTMTVYPEDSSASAVVLQDWGRIVLKTNGSVRFYNYRRIKVLNTDAFEQGNLKIIYRDYKRKDELRDLDVQITHPDGTRKKVKSDNVFTETLLPGWAIKKIFIPNLQKGSVIEYRYEMRSENILSLYDWYFQDDIPVRWSELEVTIPLGFEYAFLKTLPRAYDLNEITSISQSDGNRAKVYTWGLGKLPALRDEAFITNLDDYRSSVKFQYQAPVYDIMVQGYVSSWSQLAKVLETINVFGEQYKNPENFKNLLTAFEGTLAPGDSFEIKCQKALRFVQKNMKWNGVYWMGPETNLDDAFQKKSGNSADLNLAVVALLRQAGLKSMPLMISTRTNGKMYKEYAFVSQFNSVVALVEDGKKRILLDATNPFLPVNQLNEAHYHGSAWIVDKEKPDWIDLHPPEAAQVWYGKMKLDETGGMSGGFQVQFAGNTATLWRTELDTSNVPEFVHKKLSGLHPDMQLDSVSVLNLETPDQPLKIQFNCSTQSAATLAGGFIYCQPVLDYSILENPFKSLKRDFPVEFVTPFKAQYVLDLTLPAGYIAEDLPAPARINLPDNAGKMSFSCSENARGVLQVILKMNISKTNFSPEEYGALRQFYEFIVEKTQFQVVLKKV